MVSCSEKIVSGRNPIFSFIEAIIFVEQKIIPETSTHFSGMEKIFFISDTSFFAADKMFFAVEITVGGVPAGVSKIIHFTFA